MLAGPTSLATHSAGLWRFSSVASGMGVHCRSLAVSASILLLILYRTNPKKGCDGDNGSPLTFSL